MIRIPKVTMTMQGSRSRHRAALVAVSEDPSIQTSSAFPGKAIAFDREKADRIARGILADRFNLHFAVFPLAVPLSNGGWLKCGQARHLPAMRCLRVYDLLKMGPASAT
jgi:hypothetical protein